MLMLIVQIGVCILAVVAASIVSLVPALERYTLQFMAGAMVLFFILSRLSRKRDNALPYRVERDDWMASVEIALLSFAILLTIGATGGLSSWLLPLYMIFFLLLNFVCPLAPTLVSLIASLIYIIVMTPEMSQQQYGSLLSLIIFAPIAIVMQSIYTKLVTTRQEARLERDKVTYYNLYAEKQQAMILDASTQSEEQKPHTMGAALEKLIPKIDELQKLSRHPENQLVLSAGLTKLGLSVRKILRDFDGSSTKSAEKKPKKTKKDKDAATA